MYTILSTKTVIQGSYSDPEKVPGVFPIITLPLDGEGEEMELNDFQWVAPTASWLDWLKENPREWQAESEEFEYEYDSFLTEAHQTDRDPYLFLFQPQGLEQTTSENFLQSFDEFTQIYEKESEGGSEGLTSRAVKLTFALEKLNKEGKLKEELDLTKLEKDKEYAIIIDPVDEDKNEVIPSGRNALRFKLISQDAETISVGKIDYSLLTDEQLPDNITPAGMNKIVEKGLEAGRDLLEVGLWGISVYGVVSSVAGVAGTYLTYKGIRRWMKPIAPTAPPPAVPPAGPGALARMWTGTRTWLASSWLATGLRAVHVGAAGLPGIGSLFGGAAAVTAGGSAVSGGAILAAAAAIISGGQQVYNWSSTRQAPVYNKLKSFAKNSFVPKNIPAGDLITLCWTSDGQSTFWGRLIKLGMKGDTRTTMNLMKLANTDEKAVFLLLSVNSEQIQKEMKQYDAVLLSFDLDSIFEHGLIDNDDLEFQIIRIKPLSDYTTPTSFVAYCEWSELQSAFDSAPDSPFVVPADAPDNYIFNYKQGNERVNVEGSLLSEDQITEGSKKIFEHDNLLGRDLTDLSERNITNNLLASVGNKALSFSEFSHYQSENFLHLVEEDSQDQKEGSGGNSVQIGITKDSDYTQQEIVIYEVNSNSFANPNASGNPTDVNYFVVDRRSLNPREGQSVKVESASGRNFADAKYGLAVYQEETGDRGDQTQKGRKDDEEEEPLAPIPPQDGKQDSKDLLTSPDDVSIKDRRRRTVIKDKPTNDPDDVNIVDDVLTDQDKKDLGIQDWKALTKIVLIKDREGFPEKVILKNQTQGRDRTRRIKRGESGFETAVKIANQVKNSIKYK